MPRAAGAGAPGATGAGAGATGAGAGAGAAGAGTCAQMVPKQPSWPLTGQALYTDRKNQRKGV